MMAGKLTPLTSPGQTMTDNAITGDEWKNDPRNPNAKSGSH